MKPQVHMVPNERLAPALAPDQEPAILLRGSSWITRFPGRLNAWCRCWDLPTVVDADCGLRVVLEVA